MKRVVRLSLPEALLQHFHQVDHLCALASLALLRRRGQFVSLLVPDLFLDAREQVLAVSVLEAGRIPFAAHLVDEPLRHGELLRADRGFRGQVQAFRLANLFGETQRVHHQRLALRIDRDEVLPLAHDYCCYRGLLRFVHRLAKQCIHLRAAFAGREVIRRFEELRRDVCDVRRTARCRSSASPSRWPA